MQKRFLPFACFAALSLSVLCAQQTPPNRQAPPSQPNTMPSTSSPDRTQTSPAGTPTMQTDKSTSTKSQGSANRLNGADNTFVTKAAMGGMMEVQLGNYAKDHASNADVKAFGQRMVDDHSKANDELKSIAASKGITLPTSLSAKEQATYDRLTKLNGAEFDRAYMKDMVSDHRTDVAEFRRESQKGTDPEIKQFATKTLPTLEEHLKLAETTDAAVRTGKSDKTMKPETEKK
jgi:putative membrane protein